MTVEAVKRKLYMWETIYNKMKKNVNINKWINKKVNISKSSDLNR